MKKIKFFGAFAMSAMLAVLMLFTGCKKEEATISGITISSEAKTIKIDSTFTLTYTVESAETKVESAVWSSSSEAVATVNQDGVVKGISEGTATITITVNDKYTATCVVTVEKNIPAMTGITISSEAETINVGSTVQLSYTVEPTGAQVESAVWSSSDPSVATVDQSGLVTAIGVGNATIIITVNGAFAKECAVRVQESLPEGALPGKFSVSAGKNVYFSKGNLWCNTSTSPVTYSFESKQYDYRHYIGIPQDAAVIEGSSTTTPANTVGSFYWSKDASVAYASSYNDASSEGDQIFFTNDQTTDTNPNSSLTVNGSTGLWRVLSKDEWTYLLSTRTVNGGTGEGKSYQRTTLTLSDNTTTVYGLIIAPDNYTGSLSATTSWSDWQTMESAGCVFLPAAGYRGSSKVYRLGSRGQYWASTSGTGSNNAYDLIFESGQVNPAQYGVREFGGTVRLVCAAQ